MRSLARTRWLLILVFGWFALTPAAAQTQQPLSEVSSSSTHCSAHLDDGQLTIRAERCSLREVVDAIQLATGARVEWTGQDADEIGSVLIGPGDPASLTASMFYGSAWNFIIVSNSEGSITEILLTRRFSSIVSGVEAMAAAPAQAAPAPSKPSEKLVSKPLPSNVPAKLYDLYPSLLPVASDAGRTVQVRSGSSVSTQTTGAVVNGPLPLPPSVSTPVVPAAQPTVSSRPVLPPNIPPEIWNIYPPNLLQLVSGTKPILSIIPPPPTPPGTAVLINPILPLNPPPP